MSGLFFKPIHFNFQTTNLIIELILFILVVFSRLFSSVAKDITGALQQLLFPRIYLAGVDLKFCRDLVNGLVPFQCFDRYLGFEFRWM